MRCWSSRQYLKGGGYGITPPPPKCSSQNVSTFSVTALCRCIAFSIQLKRSATVKKYWKGACGRGTAPDPARELETLPRPTSRLGKRTDLPNPHPLDGFSVSISGAFGTSFQWTPPEIFLCIRPCWSFYLTA